MQDIDGSLKCPSSAILAADGELDFFEKETTNIEPLLDFSKACIIAPKLVRVDDLITGCDVTDTGDQEHASSIKCDFSELSQSECQENGLSHIRTRMAIFWHQDCFLHKIANHPEQPDRAAGILSKLREHYPDDCFHEAPFVTEQQILLFHTGRHLSLLIRLFEASEDAFNKSDTDKMLQPIDSDTIVMRRTRRAVFRAAGSTIAAVDALYLPCDDARYARPPGHHAERSRAGGFCFLNNAGIAAKYAQEKYGVQRVAVLDFDVHHGNGTEEGFAPHESLFYGSTHEKDNFPGTGTDPSPFVAEFAKKAVDRRIVNRTIPGGPESISHFRIKWAEVISEMVLFRPDLVIFSAGFDAHDEDPLANCELTEEDFTWATEIVLQACVLINPKDPPRVMSVLEGGYDLNALASSALAHVNALAAGYPTTTGDSKGIESLDKIIATGEILTLDQLKNSFIKSDNLESPEKDLVDEAEEPTGHKGDEAAAIAEFIQGLSI